MGKYSDSRYGAHQTVRLGPSESLATESNASATTILRHTFMYPCKVVDANVDLISGGTDLTASTAWTLGSSLAGTGSATAFGTADLLGATATHADGAVIDMTVTETTFSAGDDVVFQHEGTTAAQALKTAVNLEVVEVFVESDT